MILDTITLPDAPIVELNLDASLMKKSFCDRALQFTGVRGYEPRMYREPLVMGKALHKFAHIMGKENNFAQALKSSVSHYTQGQGEDLNKLSQAVTSYNPNLFLPLPNKDCLERYFNVPFIEQIHDGKRYIVNLCGTIDRLGVQQDDEGSPSMLVAYDYKSTRKYKIDEVIASYKFSIQFMFYYWMFRRYSHVLLHDLPDLQPLCVPGKLFVCPCPVMLSAKPISWRKGPNFSYEHMMDTLDDLILQYAETLIEIARLSAMAVPNGMMADQCSSCDFWSICHTPQNEEQRENIIKSLFSVRVYDPSAF